MKHFRILVALLSMVITLTPTVVLAAGSVDVNIWATPLVSTGITDFTIVYVSDTQLDLSWALSAGTDKIMIRGKYGEYPDDIPDALTTPSDGYLVYYDNGTSVSDTSMNFDQNPGPIYYKAWAQKLDGTWYTDTQTGSEESRAMALLFLGALALGLSYLAIRNREMIIAWIASAAWFVILAYTRTTPIGSMTTGDDADGMVVVLLIGAALAVPLISWRYKSSDHKKELKEIEKENREVRRQNEFTDVFSSQGNDMDETDAEYYDRMRRLQRRRA